VVAAVLGLAGPARGQAVATQVVRFEVRPIHAITRIDAPVERGRSAGHTEYEAQVQVVSNTAFRLSVVSPGVAGGVSVQVEDVRGQWRPLGREGEGVVVGEGSACGGCVVRVRFRVRGVGGAAAGPLPVQYVLGPA
jgi:hypothetical protein